MGSIRIDGHRFITLVGGVAVEEIVFDANRA